jgi:hypothetical protein
MTSPSNSAKSVRSSEGTGSCVKFVNAMIQK